MFFFSPYFTSTEKREGISKAFVAPSRAGQLPRAPGGEAPDAGDLHDPKHFDELWANARKRLEVTVTSAVDSTELLKRIGDEIEKRPGREIDLRR